MAKMKPSKMEKLHALVVAYPAQGHIGPMVELCLRLASSGFFRITVANIRMSRHGSSQSILRSWPALAAVAADIDLLDIPSDSPDLDASGKQAVFDVCASLRRLEHHRGLVEIVGNLLRSQQPITCILTDLYTPFTRSLASVFGLPRIVFCPQSAGTLASYYCILRRDPPPALGETVDYVPGVTTLKWSEISTSLQSLDAGNAMFQVVKECLDSIDDSACLLVNTFRELEAASLASIEERTKRRVFDIGPVLPRWFFFDDDHGDEGGGNRGEDDEANCARMLRKEDHGCLPWLDEQGNGSVLFVSFGSITILSGEQFRELALGLETSRVPILWVARPDLMADDKPIAFPDGYLDRMRHRLCLVDWAPQKQVLAHRAVGGFLTHCGWNSTLESICAGVPILGWPYFGDQMLNCRQCVDRWGVGLAVEGDPESAFVPKEEVCEKVGVLMGRSHLAVRDNCRIWKGRARQAAAADGGSSRVGWMEFLQTFVRSSSSPTC